jgi:RNA polymerase sigma factor (sigma-70 family)
MARSSELDLAQATDAQLVALARAGDKTAFGCLIDRYQAMARRIALGMLADETLAKDLSQEAVLQAYLSLKQLRNEHRFKSWFYGIVLNVCRSYIRDQKINFFSWEAMLGGVYRDEVDLAGAEPNPQELIEARELHQRVLAAVEALSPKNRAATILFYYETLSLQEIAALLNISVIAVKGRLHKSRQQLKQRLLPLYLETSYIERSQTMIKVTVVDVVAKKLEATDTEKEVEHLIIMLLDEIGQRVLPIWVGPYEGRAIALGLRKFPTQRPLTFSFMTNILEAAGVKLEAVHVNALREDTFYAIAKLRNGANEYEIDARPSDAIALAMQTNSPIYVAEEVIANAGMDVSAEMAQAPQLGRGLETIIQEMESNITSLKQKLEGPAEKSAEEKEQERERRHQELKAAMFGS